MDEDLIREFLNRRNIFAVVGASRDPKKYGHRVYKDLKTAGFDLEILDLCWADEWDSTINTFFKNKGFALVGLTLRNTDDCAFTSRQSFVDDFSEMVKKIRNNTDAMIVVGGAGFSTMPEQIMESCKADVGIWGDGELLL